MIASLEQLNRVRRFGKYEVVSNVGRGGMSAVHRARLTGPGQATKDVALKVIDPDLCGDEDFLLMFLDEMRMAMSMTHRNIVQTFDAGEQGDLLYLVMELVDGCSLRTLLDRAAESQLPLDIAVFVGMEVCAALSYAHNHEASPGQARGVIHRDISPGNILLSREGDVKLADFGVAKAAGRQAVTLADAVKGKLAYMGPEQARGQSSAASDLFALGAVLYEAISGCSIRFNASFDSVRDYAGVATPLTQLRETVPAALASLVHRCLAANPADRPASAKALRRQLQQEHAQLTRGHEPDSHARLKGYLRKQLQLRGDASEDPATRSSAPEPAGAANLLVEAMRRRVGQIPTDPSVQGAGATPADTETDLREDVTKPLRRATGQVEFTGTTSGTAVQTADLLAKTQKARRPWAVFVVVALLSLGLTLILLRQRQPAPSARQRVARSTHAAADLDNPRQADKAAERMTAGTRSRQAQPPVTSTSSDAQPAAALAVASTDSGPRRHARHAQQSARSRARRQRRQRHKALRHSKAVATGKQTQRPGRLYLNSRPWTSVIIEGEYRGETPIEGLRLGPGSYRVKLVNRKLALSRSLVIRIEAGKIVRKAIVLR